MQPGFTVRPGARCNALQSAFFVKQAGAANVGQGYVYDPVLEAANARYISGDITTEEVREEMLARLKRA
ncbi:hypothetical protein [Sinorhizobium meliloti]|uniref:Antitoxin VbhA domain-containing protein n=1 Tax=Rhizobium meliloti TaxID=382 RepID=A0AAW9TJV5_RHIML|nr:hypothetical protein [Sinorhizobium meliloti]MQW31400.1 hypothetical protein [Sinorhizobium meliloti]